MPTLTYAARDSAKAQPKLKLVYFDVAGRGECIRQTLVIGGLAFEDERVAWPDGWNDEAKAKINPKFGQVPILEVDGHQIAQTIAIIIYAGQLTGLAPTDPLQLAKVNETLHLCEDIGKGAYSVYRAPDEEAKKAAKEKYLADIVATHLPNLEKQLSGDAKFVLGDNLSIADLYVHSTVDGIVNGGLKYGAAETVDKLPKLAAWLERINSSAQFQEWVSKKQSA
jgi:glutathione S-transferase